MFVLTKIFFALQIRHARFLVFPSARTTSGANSIPNLGIVSRDSTVGSAILCDIHLVYSEHNSLSVLAVSLN
jgi:hypothetical protein